MERIPQTEKAEPLVNWYRKNDGDEGVIRTAYLMASLARKYSTSSRIIKRSKKLCGILNRGRLLHSVISNFVRANVLYKDDPPEYELIYIPPIIDALVDQGKASGDCDDMATYVASLLIACGHSPQFILGAPPNSDLLTHVYVRCHNKIIDPTLPFGTKPIYNKTVTITI